jgi:hypothetical protein
VLFFGDSLWADLVLARKLHGWTTGAIIADVETGALPLKQY